MASNSFFNTIKENVDLEDYLLNHAGVDELVNDGPGRLAACCPFHSEDTPSFKVMESSDGPWKRWWCFGSCAEGGSVIDAVMKHENFSLAYEAAMHLNELYDLGLEMNSEDYREWAKTVAETKESAAEGRKAIEEKDNKLGKIARQYLTNRGFSEETLEQFGIGVDTKAARLTIPLLDKANHPVSIATRALFDEGQCQACGEVVTVKEMNKRKFQARKAEKKGEAFEWKRCPHCDAPEEKAKLAWLARQHPKYHYMGGFDKSHFLYNEHPTRQILNKDENLLGLFVVEGYADVWSGWQADHKAIVAYNGSQMSDWQAQEMVQLVERVGKPIILIPDFDKAGLHNVEVNIRKLRSVKSDVEIQVVHDIDRITFRKPGDEGDSHAKDLGEILQYRGVEEVSRVLQDQRWPAAEWLIRQIVERINPKTGEPFHSTLRQQQLVGEILGNEESKVSLDHMIAYLARKWDRDFDTVRTWFYTVLSDNNATSYQHLFKDISQARIEAREFLQDDNVIPLGFKVLDDCMPGGGARPGQLMMVLGKSGTGKTMLASQLLAHMADSDTPSIIFSLEQAAKSLFPRLACQALDISTEDAERLIASDDPEDEKELAPVAELYKNMLIADNVPEQGADAMKMTPKAIQAAIQEANMSYFETRPAQVVVIDHLGILEVDEDAPADIRSSEHAAPGHIMQELFKVCKATGVLMIVLQQLPKEVKQGVPFSYDSGRGGSKQTDYCDYILMVWRPEKEEGIEEDEARDRKGQYKLALGKNRYGASAVAHLYFDDETLRIMPTPEVPQNSFVNPEGPVIDLEEIERSGGESVGSSASALERLTEESNPVVRDTAAYEQLISGELAPGEASDEVLEDTGFFDDLEEA